MGMCEHELESMENLIIVHNDVLRFLRKLHDRAIGKDPLQEGYQTRLDPDLQRELELILATTDEPTKET